MLLTYGCFRIEDVADAHLDDAPRIEELAARVSVHATTIIVVIILTDGCITGGHSLRERTWITTSTLSTAAPTKCARCSRRHTDAAERRLGDLACILCLKRCCSPERVLRKCFLSTCARAFFSRCRRTTCPAHVRWLLLSRSCVL